MERPKNAHNISVYKIEYIVYIVFYLYLIA